MSETERTTPAPKSATPIVHVLKHKGATITLTGFEADIAECIRRVLACPSWCAVEHMDDTYPEDHDRHVSSLTSVGVSVPLQQATDLLVGVEEHGDYDDGSGGPYVTLVAHEVGAVLDIPLSGAGKVASAILDAAAMFGDRP